MRPVVQRLCEGWKPLLDATVRNLRRDDAAASLYYSKALRSLSQLVLDFALRD
jgi:hypothetical protein